MVNFYNFCYDQNIIKLVFGDKTMKKLSILLLFFFLSTRPLAIICDLGGVFIETNKIEVTKHVGIASYLHYLTSFSIPTGNTIKNTLFSFLETLDFSHDHPIVAHDCSGMPLPSVMHAWLRGTHSCQEITTALKNELNTTQFFTCFAEKKLIEKIAHMIFDPWHFAQTRHISRSGTNFLKNCKLAGHQLFILSNWDRESFTILYNNNPAFFQLFDGIIISGAIGLIKPDPEIFTYLLETYNLQPTDCLFIDDQVINIQAAQSIGMHTCHYQKKKKFFGERPNFESVERAITLLS